MYLRKNDRLSPREAFDFVTAFLALCLGHLFCLLAIPLAYASHLLIALAKFFLDYKDSLVEQWNIKKD